jgi:hypothetical protein
MKYWSALLVAFGLILALAWCAHAECAGSGRAVLDGGASHATWRIVDGSKCWMAGYPKHGRVSAVLGRQTIRLGVKIAPVTSPAPAAIPIPRPNPLDAPRPTYDAEAALLRFMMFGTLANVR